MAFPWPLDALERMFLMLFQAVLSPEGLFSRPFEVEKGREERCARALNLFESWGELSGPDSSLWQVAELLPGADAVAFAMHLQGGAKHKMTYLRHNIDI